MYLAEWGGYILTSADMKVQAYIAFHHPERVFTL